MAKKVVIKIKFSKKQEKIINSYLDSGKYDQILKNAQMLAIIHDLMERIEKLEGREKDE